MRKLVRHLFIGLLIFTLFTRCGNKSTPQIDREDMLIQIGDSILTKQYVENQIPKTISSADSAALFHAITKKWIQSILLQEVAARNIPDMKHINELTEEYRNQLILNEYRKMMAENHSSQIEEQAITEYYEQNKDNFILNRPIIRGIYLKVPDDSRQLSNLRKWINSPSQNNIDKIESYGLKELMQYDYFIDQWNDWQNIVEQVPYRFGNANEFVKSHSNFETTHNGSTYFLYISDYILSGEVMPFEFAKPQIQEILINEDKNAYDNALINSIYNQAVKDKKIIIGQYDPTKNK